uniref:YEATS domain-containing protein 2 n=1 Tax=Scleropages formosus TaxID=113540 RepID=A0A8C9VD85_SCLFO
MSGIKRQIEDKDPDYEDISVVRDNKRLKVVEQNAREATVQKIEAIIKDQFSLEMKNKEHEIEVIGQRLNEARRMMDKLRACIVANYYASAGQPKVLEASRSDTSVLNHPAIRRFLESPSRSSSPFNQGSDVPSLVPSETESLSQLTEGPEREEAPKLDRVVSRTVGKVSPLVAATLEQRFVYHASGEDSYRLYVKKTIVVGNVSKYIPPDKREENDQSTHKWMVYVRGSRKEPSIDHFVKKVWFFLHPSYKPNDLVEVSEPPFHLTRRGWGEFPVRVQIHFKDPRNKRIDIIHHLKLDRTYTGLQTLGAETVKLISNYILNFLPDILCVPLLISLGLPVRGEAGRLTAYNVHPSERTPTRPKLVEKITLGSHGNSAFQPITASCKIIPQGQVPNPAESPGKSFQPITMSCKIVSGSPTGKQMPPAQVPQSPRSPAPSVHASGFLSSGVKVSPVFHDKWKACTGLSVTYLPLKFCFVLQVIIKQEPGEVSTSQPQQILVSTAASQQSAPQQFVSVKGGHMIAISPQKQSTSTPVAGATQSKVVGIPVGSALQSAVKQVAISSGQILVAKSAPAVSKMMMGQKQVIAQGVAKAIVSGAGGTIVGQQVQTTTKAASSSGGAKVGGQGSVMATLQLPANNLASLANLPPGTKLYLTTNSKNPSGKGKLLLIPQGAILRASNPSGWCNSTSSSSTTSLPSSLSYTSYILKQTPQVCLYLSITQHSEDSHPFCASSLEQYYSWNIGKRRAAELQRAQAVKRLVQYVLDTVPSLQTLMSPKTREVVQWCRHRGYTPPDPEPQGNEENSIEDILTQIDNEPEYPSTLQDAEELCQRLEELQALLKTEPEAEDELLDVVGVQETPSRATIKREDQKPNEELHFFLGPSPAAQFVRDTAQQIGVSLQHVELEKNVYSPVVEEMILKAMEQFASDILREALARAYLKSSQNRAPKEITAMDIHQAVAGIPACDFLTNRFMGFLVKDRTRTD